ncbi:polysaccharide lyase family 7 protein [Winogradskyella pulchriflava]|uniref:Polysaccharide lyase family 7 protein n=1 Tax=Winogradskyella pulchriflava TaxID=1110688 RepID=A0ABV6QCP9_9FLAO
MIKNFVLLLFVITLLLGCSNDDKSNETNNSDDLDITDDVTPVVYADIDFSNWKVTLPVDENNNGSPDEYQPNVLKDFGYQTLEPIMPYMYDDTSDESIVFYTFPDVSTTNSSYSRTELRELINPSDSRENWTLQEGGEMRGRLKVESISENHESNETYHKVIVMQIHGIISQEDMNTHGFSGNNGPPLIKIYWKDGYVWSHKKSLVDESTSGDDLYDVYNGTWDDIKVNLGYVGFEPFDFRITASNARIEVQLNQDEPYVYEDVSLEKWPFENYFKAGNYLTSTADNAFSYIKYYNLYVTH